VRSPKPGFEFEKLAHPELLDFRKPTRCGAERDAVRPVSQLFAKVSVEETRDLGEYFFRLRSPIDPALDSLRSQPRSRMALCQPERVGSRHTGPASGLTFSVSRV